MLDRVARGALVLRRELVAMTPTERVPSRFFAIAAARVVELEPALG